MHATSKPNDMDMATWIKCILDRELKMIELANKKDAEDKRRELEEKLNKIELADKKEAEEKRRPTAELLRKTELEHLDKKRESDLILRKMEFECQQQQRQSDEKLKKMELDSQLHKFVLETNRVLELQKEQHESERLKAELEVRIGRHDQGNRKRPRENSMPIIVESNPSAVSLPSSPPPLREPKPKPKAKPAAIRRQVIPANPFAKMLMNPLTLLLLTQSNNLRWSNAEYKGIRHNVTLYVVQHIGNMDHIPSVAAALLKWYEWYNLQASKNYYLIRPPHKQHTLIHALLEKKGVCLGFLSYTPIQMIGIITL
jgi:hypothetical protein